MPQDTFLYQTARSALLGYSTRIQNKLQSIKQETSNLACVLALRTRPHQKKTMQLFLAHLANYPHIHPLDVLVIATIAALLVFARKYLRNLK